MAGIASVSKLPLCLRGVRTRQGKIVRLNPSPPASDRLCCGWRLFSTASPPCNASYRPKVLAFYNKRSIKYRQQAGTNQFVGVSGKLLKILHLPLEEAYKVWKAWYPTNVYGHVFHLKIVAQPIGLVQMNALKDRVYYPHDFSPTKRSYNADGELIASETSRKEVVVVLAETKATVAAAMEAGADHVGGAELVQDILDMKIEPDRLFAMEDCVKFLRRSEVARNFGPRNLMPSQKRGTLANTTEELVEFMLKSRGGVDWTTNSDGEYYTRIGTSSFTFKQLRENVDAIVTSIRNSASGVSESDSETRPTDRAIKLVEMTYADSPTIILTDLTLAPIPSGRSDIYRVIPTPERLPPV